MNESLTRSIPVMGYAFRDMGMCLLDRNWEKDKKTFDTYLSNFVNAAIPVCTYICPEGTTLSESTYQRKQDIEFPTIVGTFWGVSENTSCIIE